MDVTVSQAPAALPGTARTQPRRHVGLFWRLFIPNAIVLGTACIVLVVQPPNGRIPVLVAGLVALLTVDVLILRRTVAPLLRLTELMRRVDPLSPGERIEPAGPPSEVTVLAEAFNAMLDRVEDERLSSGRRALSEIEAERRRLAAELHDEIGQAMTAVALHLDRLARHPGEDLADELVDLRDEVLEGVEAVRDLARQLRPEALDTLGLVPALTNLIERLAHRTGITMVRELDRELPPMSGDAELVLYRVAQESLTNAIRHAAPDLILVRLTADAGDVRLVVRDDGRGLPDEPAGGTGITSMRERALAIGARLQVQRRADADGTEVELRVPVACG